MKKSWSAGDQKPMLATLAEKPFDDPEWIFEVKWDGYRLMVAIENHKVRLISRNGLDVSKKYPDICNAFKKLHKNALFDGELVALDTEGLPRFSLMQNAGRDAAALVYYVFDLPFYDGKDLREEPLLERKRLLKRVMPKSPHVRFSDHIRERGTEFFKEAQKRSLEGIVGKRADSPYMSGRRSDSWLKFKTELRQEAVVIGFTEPRKSRKYIGSLILAVKAGRTWRYIGHTGGSMGGMSLRDVHAMLDPLTTDRSAAPVPKDVQKSATWVKPKVLVEVKFSEWTPDGLMRHPIVVGFRDDKRAREVVKEAPTTTGEAIISHPDKIYWPKEKYTKGDVISYYESVADLILPYIKDRPMVLNRHPNGIERQSFYQKDSSSLHLPDFVRAEMVHSESNDKDIRYIVVDNLESVRYVVNLGCIELNPWNSRIGSLDRPDFYVIDLDPGDNTFDEVIEVAKVVHEVLVLSCEQSFVKTSGKTGLHIYVPLAAKYTYDQVRSFAEILVRIVHERIPSLTSLERSPKKRRHKIYLDWLQNRRGQTLAAPYSLRPVPGATVSTPLEWKEVKKGLDPRQFTIETIHKRLKKKGDLWKGVLKKGVDLQESITCIERAFGTSWDKKRG